jgi:hypothetical protein
MRTAVAARDTHRRSKPQQWRAASGRGITVLEIAFSFTAALDLLSGYPEI